MQILQKIQIEKIENILGYNFIDKSILIKAFTHSTFANEHGIDSNEKLEFLGDSVLGFVVSTMLYDRDLNDEEVLTVARSKIVENENLQTKVDELGLIEFLIYGKCFDKKKDLKERVKAGLFEAIVGAVYLDGGLENVKKFVVMIFDKKEVRKAIFSKGIK